MKRYTITIREEDFMESQAGLMATGKVREARTRLWSDEMDRARCDALLIAFDVVRKELGL